MIKLRYCYMFYNLKNKWFKWFKWKHWFATFENFQKASKITQDADKYSLLINYINPTVYSFVSDHTTYESAIGALKEIYDKPKNILYARHLLRSTKQQSHQSLDDYIRTLRTLSQDCDFKQVTGEEYRNESIRDSFIAGINSCMIRQRILESKETGLEHGGLYNWRGIDSKTKFLTQKLNFENTVSVQRGSYLPIPIKYTIRTEILSSLHFKY